MSLFSKHKVILWPKAKTTEVYIDQKEKNNLSFDVSLWKELGDKDLESLATYFHQNKINSVSVLLPDDVVFTKSFTYDTQIDTIDKKEVIGLATNLVDFEIDPDGINYNITQIDNKTIIQALICDKPKLDQLGSNLQKIGININQLTPVSSAITNVITNIYKDDFFLIYPLNESEYTLSLSKNGSVYLTNNLKGPNLDIQKIVNYSKLYFSKITKKIYLPEGHDLEIITTTEMDKNPYSEIQIAQSLSKPSNLPLPVLGEIISSSPSTTAIIKSDDNISSQKPSTKMEPNKKKNILPLIAVFIFAAALASVIIWFVLNRNSTSETKNLSGSSEETQVSVTPAATATPVPTIAEIDKDIKIQVLNATDINGQAATLKADLTDLGFTDVTVGNAKEDATENSVQTSSEEISAYFESELENAFPDATYTEDLESSTYDAIFIIGTDLSESGTSTEDEE